MTVETACPHCGSDNDIHDGAESARDQPNRGDVSICALCKCLSVFTMGTDGTLYLRKPSDDELQRYMKDPRVRIALQALITTPNVYAAIQASRAGIWEHRKEAGGAGPR